jgi:hypothetical protein
VAITTITMTTANHRSFLLECLAVRTVTELPLASLAHLTGKQEATHLKVYLA